MKSQVGSTTGKCSGIATLPLLPYRLSSVVVCFLDRWTLNNTNKHWCFLKSRSRGFQTLGFIWWQSACCRSSLGLPPRCEWSSRIRSVRSHCADAASSSWSGALASFVVLAARVNKLKSRQEASITWRDLFRPKFGKKAKLYNITWRPWACKTSTFGITWCDNFWPNKRLEVAEGFHIRWRMLAAQKGLRVWPKVGGARQGSITWPTNTGTPLETTEGLWHVSREFAKGICTHHQDSKHALKLSGKMEESSSLTATDSQHQWNFSAFPECSSARKKGRKPTPSW